MVAFLFLIHVLFLGWSSHYNRYKSLSASIYRTYLKGQSLRSRLRRPNGFIYDAVQAIDRHALLLHGITISDGNRVVSKGIVIHSNAERSKWIASCLR